MVLKLPRAPTPKQEHAYYWWVDRYGDRSCDYCGSQIDLSDIHTSNEGVYCSQLCWHMDESTISWTEGELGHDSGRVIR